MLNVWVIPAKITTMEKRMESMENEMKRLKTENKVDTNIKMDELMKQNQGKKFQFVNSLLKLRLLQLCKFVKLNESGLIYSLAFSAFLLSSFGPQSVGPFHNGLHTLIYEYVNSFIYPERAVTAGLFKNDQHIISTHGHQASGFISSSNGVSLLLEEGDQMKVNLYPGQWIFDDGEHHHSTFSGHLLFPM
uniref:C1q domain-containing protein n=1 Tax=Sinocyclocheilus grahami TaxID=75366 RepID=A0A672KE03_SINGR